MALAPAGGWAPDDDSYRELLRFQRGLLDMVRAAAPHAETILASREGRRRATRYLTVNYEHIPPELLVHQLRGVAVADAAPALIEHALQSTWSLDAEGIVCPVRIIWGTEDVLLPWPRAAIRFRNDGLPHADWVELDGVGHCPQLDVPLETAQLFSASPRPLRVSRRRELKPSPPRVDRFRMRPARALTLLLLCMLLVPAAASSRPLVGIGDHDAASFQDRAMRKIGLKTARLTLVWDWHEDPASSLRPTHGWRRSRPRGCAR